MSCDKGHNLVWFPDPFGGGEREGSGELLAACTDPRLHSTIGVDEGKNAM